MVNKTSLFKNKPGIPVKIRELLKPALTAPSDDNLLERCLHGKTQNNNECLNGVIWKRCPKDVYVGQQTLEMGVSSAVISFYEGMNSISKVMQHYGMSEGYFTNRYCNNKDSMDYTKKARIRKRTEQKGYCDKDTEREGDVDGAGLCAIAKTYILYIFSTPIYFILFCA